MLLAERHESERLRQIIKELQRHRFGRKAESLPEEQMLLGLEDVEQVAASAEAGQDETAPEGREERARKRRVNRGALPAHLPRIEVVIDFDDKTCPCCQGEPFTRRAACRKPSLIAQVTYPTQTPLSNISVLLEMPAD